ncbi:hypothetical protein [Sphingomonas alpina]|uniref:Uncharacterized protein n=1 Tax=Sphingomonas alpina TaxID=653931 RepID=A0A7H0LGB8_9SPHN|nr:hypothetical protein [Sphingomonas alpina]QNQ08721.1 hypothetical protein H3Z74_18580 [Sphingomonas alpina]
MKTIRKALLVAGTALLAAGLAACSGSEPAPAPTENSEAISEPTPEPSASPTPEASPVIETNSTAEAAPEPTAVAPDEQMLDDASATGMTARTSRGEPATDDTAATSNDQSK